jgi:hypothetical protein
MQCSFRGLPNQNDTDKAVQTIFIPYTTLDESFPLCQDTVMSREERTLETMTQDIYRVCIFCIVRQQLQQNIYRL